MTRQDYEKFLAELATDKRILEETIARDLKQELARLETTIDYVQAQIARFPQPADSSNGHGSPPQGIGAREPFTLADLGKECLISVNEAWLTPKEIGQRLVASGYENASTNLAGHVSTALRRRINSRLAPDKDIEYVNGRFRYKRKRPSPE
jgi:hypothetical protein